MTGSSKRGGALAATLISLGVLVGAASAAPAAPAWIEVVARELPQSFPVVSEHILQIAEVAAKGAAVFDSKEQFRVWLSLPNKALGNKTPLSLMNTKRGSDMVMDILVRIEHGVYS